MSKTQSTPEQEIKKSLLDSFYRKNHTALFIAGFTAVLGGICAVSV